jgi:hypothetical protein
VIVSWNSKKVVCDTKVEATRGAHVFIYTKHRLYGCSASASSNQASALCLDAHRMEWRKDRPWITRLLSEAQSHACCLLRRETALDRSCCLDKTWPNLLTVQLPDTARLAFECHGSMEVQDNLAYFRASFWHADHLHFLFGFLIAHFRNC